MSERRLEVEQEKQAMGPDEDRTIGRPAYRDLREWISGVEALDELRHIQGARAELEIGALTDWVCNEVPNRSALLFEEIPGYDPGHRILVNALTSVSRVAYTVGESPALNERDFVLRWRQRMRAFRPIPPQEVSSGPVLENVAGGKEVNLLKFPAPLWHKEDGGRYLGTGDIVISRDPDEGWVNLGTYRAMVYDEGTIGLYISPGHHGRLHRERYHAQGKPFPVIISCGHDPLLFMAATMSHPYGVSEYDFVGGVRGEPVPVIRGEVTGLPFPAQAELVIEGESMPGETRPEGPFGEFTGYYASGTRPESFVRVRRIYHRNDPIILGLPPNRPYTGASYHMDLFRAAMVWEQMEAAGVPDVRGVWGCMAQFWTFIAIHQRYPGHARQAALVASQCHAGAYMSRFFVVFDDDVNIFNINDVLWAMATRVDPEHSIEILRRCWSGPLDPIIPPERKGFNSKMIIDACRPFEWRDKFPRVI